MGTLKEEAIKRIKIANEKMTREQDEEWDEWRKTPQGTFEILQCPAKGVRPSERTRNDILDMLEFVVRD